MARNAVSFADNSQADPKKHLIAWSGGKDSTATVILFHEHEAELRAPGEEVFVLFYEVMFDKKAGVTGHNPDIIDFVYGKKGVFESWGYKVLILRSELDFLDVFYHRMERSSYPERIGKHYGFPLPGGRCAIKRDCKEKPRDEWLRDNAGNNYVEYVGIAADEVSRLESLKKNPHAVSLLEKYGVNEAQAFEICRKYDLLSSFYGSGQKRDGCWFCPYAKLNEHRMIKENLPDAWAKYVSLEQTDDLAFCKWNCYSSETLAMRDKALDEMQKFRQLSIFDLPEYQGIA